MTRSPSSPSTFIDRTHAEGDTLLRVVQHGRHALPDPLRRETRGQERSGILQRRHGRPRPEHRQDARQARRARHRRRHHRLVLHRQRSALQQLAGRRASPPFRAEKNTNWEGGWRVPAFVRWPGKFKAGTVLNGIVSRQDWLPTFLAAAGEPDVNQKLLAGSPGRRQDLQRPYRRLQHAPVPDR